MDARNPLVSPEVRQALERMPGEVVSSTTALLDSFSAPRSRRWLLRGVMAGTDAAALTSTTALQTLAVHAEVTSGRDDLAEFFNILATGEALFVTFYQQAVIHHQQLGFHGAALNALEAIRAEEEIHRQFAVANGGVPATTHFSFPHGPQTFKDRSLFLKTQQLSEELTNGALLAWIKDMASM